MSLRILPWESCDRCRGVPGLRWLDELGEAANRPNKPQGETRVSPAPGGRIFPHAATCSRERE
jgi:hypothetical protein